MENNENNGNIVDHILENSGQIMEHNGKQMKDHGNIMENIVENNGKNSGTYWNNNGTYRGK